MLNIPATPVLQLEHPRAFSFSEIDRLPRLTAVCVFFLALLGSSVAACAQTAHFSGTITTLGSFNVPYGLSVDGSGNVFVAAQGATTVKEILAAGGYTTVTNLGSGFSYPTSVAVDGSGNVFVADYNNSAVKEILAAGGYTTVHTIGSGFRYPTGVALDASGNVFVADQGHSAVKEILAAGGYTTVTTIGSGFASPNGVAVDRSGNVFVADTNNSQVKEVLAASGYTTINTIGSGFAYPTSVTVDGSENVFVADANHGAVKEILAVGGYTTITTLGSGSFFYPTGVAVDRRGNVFVADPGVNAVEELMTQGVNFGSVNVASNTPVTLTLNFSFDTAGTILAPSVVTQGIAGLDFTDAGTGTCTTNGTAHTYNSGDSCTVNVTFNPKGPGRRTGAVELLSSSGSIATAYSYGVGLAGQAGFDGAGVITTLPVSALSAHSYVYGVTTDAAGNVYIADDGHCVVIKKVIATGVSSVLAGNGSCGNTSSGSGGPATSASFESATSVAVDGRGDILVADTEGKSISKIDVHTGILRIVAGTPGSGGYSPDGTLATNAQLSNPIFVAVDGASNFYIPDGEGLIRKVDAVTGLLTTVAGNYSAGSGYSGDGGLATNAQLNEPTAITVDAQGNLYIADDANNAIRKVDAITGIITTVAGMPGSGNSAGYSGDGGLATNANLNDPENMSVDAAGNIYIVDSSNNVVRKVSSQTGIITTVAGVYSSVYHETYTGDGGPANLAGFAYPQDLAVAPDGTLYIADSDNRVIRSVTQSLGTAAFGSLNVGTSSPATDVTVTNNGSAALNLSALVASTNFNLNGLHTSCTTSTPLAAGASCVLGIEFLPTTAGSLMGAITLTDDANNDVTSTQSVALSGTGNQATPTQVALSVIASPLVSGGNLGTVTVTVESANGTPVTSSTASVIATITGPNGYSQMVTANAVNGVANLDLSSFRLTASGSYIVTASSAGLSSDQAAARVNPGPETQLVSSALPSTLVSGGNLGNVTVTVEDVFGNSVNTPTTVTLTITGPNGYSQTLTGRNSDGPARFNLSSLALTADGTYTVTTTSPGLTGTSSTVTVTAGAASKLATSTVASTVVSGSNLGTISATVEDASGNTVTSSTAPVTATITGPNGYSQTVTANAVNGMASLNLSSLNLTTAGTYTVTTSSTGVSGTTSMVTVTAGAASKLATSTVPSTVVSGGNLGTISATVEDANGNTVITSTAPVTATITGPNGYSQTVTAAAVNGVASLNLSSLGLTTAGTYTVTTSGTGLTGTSSIVTVTAGAASKIALGTVPTSITSGQSLGTTTATVEDASGNTVTGSTATVTATLTGPNGYSQTVNGASVNGVASLNLSSLTPTVAGTYTLTVSGSGLTTASTTITVADAPQTIALPTLPNVTYGTGATTLPTNTSAGLPITYAVTGPASLSGSSLVVTGAGTVTLTANQAGDASHSAVTMTESFTVAQAASMTTLSSSSGVATTGTSVTLTTQVASTAGTPTGTVTFLNGSTVLGTATVSSTGIATLAVSTLPTGSLSLTAAYSGDANFRASVSAASVTGVQDFGIAPTSGTPSVPVVPGAAANFILALTPGTAGFSSAITLTATGLPAGATYSFSPATVTPGSATPSTVLTVQTSKPVATARNLEGAAGITFALLFLPLGISRKRREALSRTRLLSALGVLLFLGGLAGLTGCGTSNGFFGQPQQSYTLTVTGTSGTLAHSTTVVLNVQ